jgi:hypothetical protein
MKSKLSLKVFCVGVLAGVIAVLSIGAVGDVAPRQWEYRVVQGAVFGQEGRLEDAMNKSAADGWEFVSASPSLERYGFAVMKRQKQ